jgi:hypothetical protein
MAMPGLVLHANATATCSHGGQLRITPTQFRAQVSGQAIATSTATLTVLACPGVSGAVCTAATWANVSSRILVDHQPVLLQAPVPIVPPSPGNGVIAGPPPNVPLMMAAQFRVVAT